MLSRCSSRVVSSSRGRLAAAAATVAAPRAVSAAASVRHLSQSAPRSAAAAVWKVDDPYTGEIVAEIEQLTEAAASQRVTEADAVYRKWRGSTLSHRIQLLNKWCAEFSKQKEAIAVDVSTQMGKPLSQARGEVDTAVKRAEAIIKMASSVLAEDVIEADPDSGLLRKISKEPIGVVLALVPWNYPLLCAVNTVVAATLAGNSVLIKHSDRSPAAADWFEKTFEAAGAPKGLVTAFHADHALVQKVIADPKIAYVQFTGSVAGGRAVYAATAASRFIDVGLELGGKDPAYIAADADLQYAIANVVDGGMFNAGQSCCAVERVYVHESHYESFLSGAAALLAKYKLGHPHADDTTMGPLAQPKHPHFLLRQVEEAVKAGARLVTGGQPTHDDRGKGRFFQPTLLADCTKDMSVVREESFGPLLAVQKVKSDEEAIAEMNHSDFGLTASVWSSSVERASRIGSQLNTGTVFMNRCDFLDPLLAWSGRKDSGKGIGLSTHGFAPFFRTKSWNFRPRTQ